MSAVSRAAPTSGVSIDPRSMAHADREFLPAALEILEVPPSPLRMILIWVIAVLGVVTLTWSWIGRVDIVAVAQGKLQPAGRVKAIQPLETGAVRHVRAANGQHVRQGDTLVEFDPTDAISEQTGIEATLVAARAEIQRRRAVTATIRGDAETIRYELPPIAWPEGTPEPVRLREEGVASADLRQLSATLAGLHAQRLQKQAERGRLEATISAQQELIDVLAARVDMRATLVEKAAGTRASLIDARETHLNQKTAIASQIGQRAETDAALEVLDREMVRVRRTVLADYAQKASDAERQADDLEQRAARARARTGRMTLTSPIAGTVQASSLTTVGQVVTTGEELMRIVPEGTVLEVEAYLPNRDVGFVRPGDVVAVKIEPFPFTRYGTIIGRVERVATDAIPEPDAQTTEANPAGIGDRGSRAALGRAQRVQNLVFPVTIALERMTIEVDGRSVPLSSGMSATVEVKTGDRRILEYLFSPLVEVASQAIQER